MKAEYIDFISISTGYGNVISQGQKPTGDYIVSRAYPLVYTRPHDNVEAHWLGELTIEADLQPIYEQMWQEVFTTLVSKSVKMFTLAFLICSIVGYFVFRHLATISGYTRALDLDNLTDPLKLKRQPQKSPDELADIAHALNQMRLRLFRETNRLKKTESQFIKERDQAIQASKAKSLFLANMSHELRTPMNGVLGTARLLKDTGLNPLQSGYADIINRSGKNLLAILNDVLDYSKIEAGHLEIRIASFDLHQMVQDTYQLMEGRAAEKKLNFDFHIVLRSCVFTSKVLSYPLTL